MGKRLVTVGESLYGAKVALTIVAIAILQPSFALELKATPETIDEVIRAMNPGDRIVLAAGEYRRYIHLPPGRKWSASLQTTITGCDNGHVVVKGSDVVSGWREIRPKHYEVSWPAEPAQVFVDGTALMQLGGTVFGGYPEQKVAPYVDMHKESGGGWPGRRAYVPGSELPMNSFYYDKSKGKLQIRIDGNANSKKVEVSVRSRLLYGEGVHGIVVERLIFEHSNTSISGRGAAVTLIGNDNTIRNVTVRDTDLAGIQMVGDRNQLLDSVATNNGQLGVAMRGSNNRVVGVDASHNNTRGFNKWWEAGGFKFVGNGGLQASEVSGNRAVGNNGDGIWFDWKNKNNIVRSNLSAFNSGFGIHYEASRTAVIQDNYIFGNGQRGIYLADSANCWITHNLVVGNGLEGIVAVFSGRKDEKNVEFGAEQNKVYANIIAWNKGPALIMPRGASRSGEADGNVYFSEPKALKFSLGYPSLISTPATTLSEWSAKTGFDKRSVAQELTIPQDFKSALAKKSLTVDWSSLIHLAKNIRASNGSFYSDVLIPGRQEELVGPRQ